VDAVAPAQAKAIVPTDLDIDVPHGTYGRIAPRSGLAAKHHLEVGAGVIDADLSVNVKIVLFNYGNLDFNVSKGDRFAQLLLKRNESPPGTKALDLPGWPYYRLVDVSLPLHPFRQTSRIAEISMRMGHS